MVNMDIKLGCGSGSECLEWIRFQFIYIVGIDQGMGPDSSRVYPDPDLYVLKRPDPDPYPTLDKHPDPDSQPRFSLQNPYQRHC